MSLSEISTVGRGEQTFTCKINTGRGAGQTSVPEISCGGKCPVAFLTGSGGNVR